MMRWYVIHTRPNAERRAVWNLRNQGFTDVYLPCYRRRRSHARRVDWIRAPLFPRYLFIRLDIEITQWRSILSTTGVSDIIRNSDNPVPLAEGIIETLKGREARDELPPVDVHVEFHVGEPVDISFGPLGGQRGLFDRGDGRKRVIVLVDMLGRHVRLSVDADAVKKAA
jgi:transcriptional antiterminator RfaH